MVAPNSLSQTKVNQGPNRVRLHRAKPMIPEVSQVRNGSNLASSRDNGTRLLFAAAVVLFTLAKGNAKESGAQMPGFVAPDLPAELHSC